MLRTRAPAAPCSCISPSLPPRVSTRPARQSCCTRALADAAGAAQQEPQSRDPLDHPSLSHYVTGGRLGSTGSSRCLLPPEKLPLLHDKQIVLVRHGMSTWNLESRIQGECAARDSESESNSIVWGLQLEGPLPNCSVASMRRNFCAMQVPATSQNSQSLVASKCVSAVPLSCASEQPLRMMPRHAWRIPHRAMGSRLVSHNMQRVATCAGPHDA